MPCPFCGELMEDEVITCECCEKTGCAECMVCVPLPDQADTQWQCPECCEKAAKEWEGWTHVDWGKECAACGSTELIYVKGKPDEDGLFEEGLPVRCACGDAEGKTWVGEMELITIWWDGEEQPEC